MGSNKKVRESIRKMMGGSVFGEEKETQENDLGLGKGNVELHEIHLGTIKIYDQVRKKINEEDIEELAQSIRSRGLLQPIVVQPENDGYRLIAGHCRFRAYQKLGLPKILAIIKKPEDAADVKVDQIVENIQRSRLNAVDTSFALSEIMELKKLSQKELADIIGKQEGYVSKLIGIKKMVEKLSTTKVFDGFPEDPNSKEKLSTSKVFDDLTEDTLYYLSRLPIELVVKAVKKIKEKKFNVFEAREFISKLREGKDIDDDKPIIKKDIEEKLKDIINTTREISDKVMRLKIQFGKEISEEIEDEIRAKLSAEASRFIELISALFKGKAVFDINLKVNKTCEIQFPNTSILVPIQEKLVNIGYSFLDYSSSKADIKKFIKSKLIEIQDSIFEEFPPDQIIDQWNALPWYSIKKNIDGFFFKAVTEKYKIPPKLLELKNEINTKTFDKYNFKSSKKSN